MPPSFFFSVSFCAGGATGKERKRNDAVRIGLGVVWGGFITTDDAFSEKYAINIIFFFILFF